MVEKKANKIGKIIALCFVLVCLFLLTGCLGGQSPIMVRQWALEYPYSQSSRPEPFDEGIRLKRFTASMDYISTEMVYRPTSFERGVYPYNRWRVRPAEMVCDLLLRDIKSANLFIVVNEPDRSAKTRFVLEGQVTEFLENDNPGQWEAHLGVNLTLLDNKYGRLPERIVFQKHYQEKVKIEKKGASGLAKAMSQALENLSNQVLSDIASAVQKLIEKEKATKEGSG